jgi:hypothetical protein
MVGVDYKISKEENEFMHKERIRREITLNDMIH